MTPIAGTGKFGRLATCLSAALALSAMVGCKGVLDVEDPQAFGDADLNSAVILKNVADGAEGLLHQSYDDFIVYTELLGDAMESTSTWIDWEDISEGRVRADWPTAGNFSDPQNQLLRARFAAQSAAERFTKVLGADAATSPLLTQVKWVDGMSDLVNGEGWCEGPLVAGGPRQPNTEFFKQAVTKLTAALTSANGLSGTAKTPWVNTILASRARANLFAGNNDAALADASAVPDGFVKLAVFAEGSFAQQSTTGNQFNQNRNRSGGLRRMYHSRVLGSFNTTSYQTGYLKDWFDATKADPRMAVTRKEGELGVNNRFAYFGITKYADRAADITMLSKREMNLIAAEVYFRRADYTNEAAKLNIDRVANGLAAIPVPTSAADAQSALLNERFAVLFIEGQRMYDLARFNLVTATLGPGRATMLPMSITELLNNTSMKLGEATCPKIS